MCNLGVCYKYGTGVKKDEKKAIKWYTKAAELGYARAICYLGECYYYGTGVKKEEKKAVELFTKAAELGNARAMGYLGICYENGTGVAKDEKKAVEWYTKGAELGDDQAMLYLGICYGCGTGVSIDDHEAFRWFLKSAKLNNSFAMRNLGIYHDNGAGVPYSAEKAFAWYKKAAELNNSSAMYYLANCYASGSGITKDTKEAFEWYNKAAELGDCDAMYKLGVCYMSGTGAAIDIKMAVKWYTKAADLGNVNALFNLGQLYEYGIGTDKSDNQALYYYRKANEKGHSEASKKIQSLEGNAQPQNKDGGLINQPIGKESEAHNQDNMTLKEKISRLTKQLEEKERESLARNLDNMMLKDKISNLTEQLREKERESEARNQDSMILQIGSMMNSMESRLTARMDEISDITKETNDNVKSLTDYIKNELPKKIASLRTEFGVDTLSETELTEADEKKIGEFCKTVRAAIEKQFDEKNDLIRQSRKDLSNRFGNVWNRLCQETQNSLVSGMTLWKAYKNIDDPNFDFSGICILATSALENELRKIFFEEFQEFVKNQTGGKINRYPSIFTYRKGTELVAGKSEYFALGKMPFLFGQTGKDPSSEDLSDIKRLNDFREKYLESIIDSQKMIDSGVASFSECFTKPFFSKNSELKKEKNFHVYYKGSLISEFEDIRNKYRNKSAHQGGLRRDEAHDCCNLVFGSSIMGDNDLEKVLGLIQKVYYLLKQ